MLISVWDLLNLKGHYSSPILQLSKEKPETVEFETHTQRSVTFALGFCLSTINRHVHTADAQETHTCSLLHIRTCTEKHSGKKVVFGCGVITGAEKAMCLQ